MPTHTWQEVVRLDIASAVQHQVRLPELAILQDDTILHKAVDLTWEE